MKIISNEQFQKIKDNTNIIQCPRCLRLLDVQNDEYITSCIFCSYNLKQFNMQKVNSKLYSTIQILLQSISFMLQNNQGIVIQKNKKKYLIFKKDNQPNIQAIQDDIQNYAKLINGKFVILE